MSLSKFAFFWHTDERTVTLFHKFASKELDPHEFLNRLISVKESLEFSMKQDAQLEITGSVLPDEHESFAGIG